VTESTSPFVSAALAYGERGWPIFPCQPGAKRPLTAHGFKDASTDGGRIRGWWRRWPNANVAVATGAPGPDVLDVDTKNGAPGMELFERVKATGLLRGAFALVDTPSGGLHVYFAGSEQAGGAVGAHRALELKGRGGYVLVPPSVVLQADGSLRPYELTDQRDPGPEIDWAAVRRMFEPPRPLPRLAERDGLKLERLVRWIAGQPEGNRNAGLYWACRRAIESSHDPAGLLAAAVAAGLPAPEAERTLLSARRATRRAP
jgi:hypothetical protein